MKLSITVSEKALEASYLVAKLIACQKKKKRILLAKRYLKPACLEIVRLMLGPKEVRGSEKCLCLRAEYY